jgi:hypothetical protein
MLPGRPPAPAGNQQDRSQESLLSTPLTWEDFVRFVDRRAEEHPEEFPDQTESQEEHWLTFPDLSIPYDNPED